jgi:hypothetical protein
MGPQEPQNTTPETEVEFQFSAFWVEIIVTRSHEEYFLQSNDENPSPICAPHRHGRGERRFHRRPILRSLAEVRQLI